MPQSTVFPIRTGLSVPKGEQVQAVEVLSEGGLDKTQSVIGVRPGYASTLTNFEVALTGGYRRINGFFLLNESKPAGSGPILGVAVYYSGFVLAARQTTASTYVLYENTGATWASISTSPLTYAPGMIVQSVQYNWTGTHKILFTDGVNPAYTWDGTNFVVLNGAGSAADPTVAAIFNGYLFVSGYSSNYGAVKVSAPLNETDWNPVDGAAEFVIGDKVVALHAWRDQLIVFCANSIHKIVGNSTDVTSSTPFQVQPVTDRVGCIEGRTVQECDGDLLYLAQDGVRTISGTFNIGDTEIGSISRPIQDIVSRINPISTPVHSLVVRKKTQYRIFFADSTFQIEPSTNNAVGILGSIRRFRDGHEAWEWGQLAGFNVSCCTSGYMVDGNEYVIAGGNDGFVYRQEIGNTLNGANIEEEYITVPFDLGDRGTRKAIYRVTVYIAFEGASSDLSLTLMYDYDTGGITQPSPYQIFSNNAFAYNDTGISVYDTSTYSDVGLPLIRQLVQGSGFLVQLGLSSNGGGSPYVIQGYYIEYFPAGRR